MLRVVDRALDVVLTPTARDPQHLTEEMLGKAVGYSANRKIEVVLIGGSVSEVKVDPAWADSVNHQKLSDPLSEAFEAAYAERSLRQDQGFSPVEGCQMEIARTGRTRDERRGNRIHVGAWSFRLPRGR